MVRSNPFYAALRVFAPLSVAWIMSHTVPTLAEPLSLVLRTVTRVPICGSEFIT